MTDIIVTDAVYDKLAALLIEEDDESIAGLRISIRGGGCSGFQYNFQFTNEVALDDTVFESGEGLKIVVDPLSIMYMAGATIDYSKTLAGEQFSISNPNAQSTCGCGSSFSA